MPRDQNNKPADTSTRRYEQIKDPSTGECGEGYEIVNGKLRRVGKRRNEVAPGTDFDPHNPKED